MMQKQPSVQIKGLVRFSYLSRNGFAASRHGPDHMRAMLYDPARLDHRFRLFETLCLPTLARQEDPDFALAVLIGDSLPDAARARLEALLSDLPQAHIVALPPLIHIQAVKRAYEALPAQEGATHVAGFRIDDDDAMHRGTVGRIRLLANHLLQIRRPETPFAISFNRGFYLDNAAPRRLVECYEKTPIGIGLTLVAPQGDQATVFRRNHRQLTQYYDCYSEVDEPMFIRSVHAGNDSGATPSGRVGPMSDLMIRRKLRRGFGLSPEELEGL